MDLAVNGDFRQQFNLPDGLYLLSHSVGCLPKQAQQTLHQRYLNPWQQHGGDAWPAWLGIIDDFCAQLAVLLNASARDICPQNNVSSALTKYLMSFRPSAAKNVILMHESAFPSVGFVASALQQQGYRLEFIEKHCDPRDLHHWQQHITGQTAVVLITHVHSNSGILSPVNAIAGLAKAQGARVIVDVAQSVGVVPIDLSTWQADCVIGSCVKWLCGGPGAGFIWLESEHLATLTPQDVGWFSHRQPFEFDIRHFAYAADAKRFWGGTPNIASYATALGSLQLINQMGVARITAHNRQLREKVYAAAEPLLSSQHTLSEEGGTLCLDFQPEALLAFVEDLQAAKAFFDQREGVVRLSLHLYNTVQDVETLVAMLKKLRL